MFTIDLLKGTEKPPGSHPLFVAGVALAFALVATGAVFDGVHYFGAGRQLAAEQQAAQHSLREIAKLVDVTKMLQAAEKRRKEVNASLAEVNTVLTTHAKWSPLVAAAAQSASNAITISDLAAKREEIRGKYEYSFTLGVVASSGPVAVEEFVRTLRQTLPLRPGPDSVRIISQRQQQWEGRDFQYYVIECQLRP
jgi:hypothetical protein